MSEIRVGGQPLNSLLEGYSACFSYQFPIDNQNKFLMEVATEVKEESARLLCLKIYKFYTDLLANANRLVNDVSKASVFEDKVYIVVEVGNTPVGRILTYPTASRSKLEELALGLESVKKELVGKKVSKIEIYGTLVVRVVCVACEP